MLITKDVIKAEIDKVEDKYLEALYKIIKALKIPASVDTEKLDWSQFIEATYGSLRNAPIERGDQGEYESREPLA